MSTVTIPDISVVTNRPSPPPLAELDIWCENGKAFLVGRNGEYVQMSTTDLRRHLLSLGFSAARRAPLSEVEQAIHDIQFDRSVAYAGPLAGKSAGVHYVGGKRILVTGGPRLVQPNPKVKWPLIQRLFEEMFGGDDAFQLPHLFGWLSHAFNSLRAGVPSQGQALAFAGPRDSGKSLVQQLIRELLGGREANPYAFMTGRTDFNRDLFGAENLMFGDEVASKDYRNRVSFGGMLKQLVVNTTQRCHGKGREAVVLDPFWRVTMSVNDEAESLAVLPPLSQDSLMDKIMLLRAKRPKFFDTPEWRGRTRPENWARLMAELPGFAAFLSDFKIPQEIVDTRLGVKHVHHPDLLVALGEHSPEMRLLELIDSAQLFVAKETATKIDPEARLTQKPHPVAWVGTASQLEARLQEMPSTSHSSRKLLYYHSACGQYLSTLARSRPDRVKSLGTREGIARYEISPAISSL